MAEMQLCQIDCVFQSGEVFYPAIAGFKSDEIEDGMRCEGLVGS